MRTFTDAQRASALAKLGPLPQDWHPKPGTVVAHEVAAATLPSQTPAEVVAMRKRRSAEAKAMRLHRQKLDRYPVSPIAHGGA
jgi:hypothetical protein